MQEAQTFIGQYFESPDHIRERRRAVAIAEYKKKVTDNAVEPEGIRDAPDYLALALPG